MADNVTTYQCPACGGGLQFGSESGLLECPFCHSHFTVDEIEQRYREAHDAGKAGSEHTHTAEVPLEDSSAWENDMVNCSCPSCGAQVFSDAVTMATSCPFCGNPALVQERFSGALKPDMVIPFKLDKEAAIHALKQRYRRKPLLPRLFSQNNTIEKIQGIYVPFWLFDTSVHARGWFNATNVHVHRQGNYEITETEYYDVYREGNMQFEKVPADASVKMADDFMDSIEPYNYAELTPFQPAYLTGYLADRYDVSREDAGKRIERRCGNTAMSMLQGEVTGYTTVSEQRRDIDVKWDRVHYVMLPVWVLHTRWQNEDYVFMMNGQTGKLAGDLPVSAIRRNVGFGITTVVLSILFGLLLAYPLGSFAKLIGSALLSFF